MYDSISLLLLINATNNNNFSTFDCILKMNNNLKNGSVLLIKMRILYKIDNYINFHLFDCVLFKSFFILSYYFFKYILLKNKK